jgi:para-nitrobenzyl esterase
MILLPRLLTWSAAACVFSALSSLAQPVQNASTASGTNPGPVISAPSGKVEGRMEVDLRVFKRIPFAQPPIGERRWKPPAPLPPWTGVRKATDFEPACLQPKPQLSTLYTRDPMPMSEDCLTVNIWAPRDARKAPVFFWIYGGALTGGASREPFYDGAKLAA